MKADQQNLLNKAADARLIHMNEQLLFPILEGKVEQYLSQLCETFKDTGEVKVSAVAYIAACRDLMQELEAKARHGDRAAEKLNLNPPI